MLVRLIALDKIIFEGEAEAIVVPGKQGQLTILPHHLPLICPLGKGKIKINKKKEKEELTIEERIFFEIEEGILKVNKEGVDALVVTHAF
jgi:F-type H+-transporting ATPase subunit epsilon